MQVFTRHTKRVNDLASSPDGRQQGWSLRLSCCLNCIDRCITPARF